MADDSGAGSPSWALETFRFRWLSWTLVTVIASAVLVTAFTLAGRGSFGSAMLAAGVAVVGVPLLVFAGVFALLRRRWRYAPAAAQVTLCLALVALSSLASWLTGTIPRKHDEAAARAYCDALIPRIEAWKADHGAWPDDLSVLGDLGPTPRLVQGQFYYADTNGYRLYYHDAVTWIGGWHYDSTKGTWEWQD